METQHNLARVLREVAVEFPDFVARARSVWKHGWTGAGSADLLDLTRGDR